MATLTFKKLNRPAESTFSCGNHSIDEQIKEAYLLTCMNRCYAYQVVAGEKVVGFYQVQFKRFEIDEFDPPLCDFMIGCYEDLYTLHIAYIAVRSENHGHGIGSKILEHILEDAYRMHEKCPFRLVTLDALKEKVEWYKKLNFVAVGEDKWDSPTQLMMIDLISPEAEAVLNEYSEA